jgi:hypothetical protein
MRTLIDMIRRFADRFRAREEVTFPLPEVEDSGTTRNELRAAKHKLRTLEERNEILLREIDAEMTPWLTRERRPQR